MNQKTQDWLESICMQLSSFVIPLIFGMFCIWQALRKLESNAGSVTDHINLTMLMLMILLSAAWVAIVLAIQLCIDRSTNRIIKTLQTEKEPSE